MFVMGQSGSGTENLVLHYLNIGSSDISFSGGYATVTNVVGDVKIAIAVFSGGSVMMTTIVDLEGQCISSGTTNNWNYRTTFKLTQSGTTIQIPVGSSTATSLKIIYFSTE